MASRRRARHSRPSKATVIVSSAASTTVTASVIATTIATGTHAPVIHASLDSFRVPGVSAVATVKSQPVFSEITVQQGQTLSEIASNHCGKPSAWSSLYHANQKAIGSNPNLIFPRERLVLDCSGHATESAAIRPAVTAVTHVAHFSSGVLSAVQLGALWLEAGGSTAAEATAECIAEHESSGRINATDYDGDGTIDRGLWQINSTHGSLSTYDPLGNARAAVEISDGGAAWGAWMTAGMCDV